MKKYYRSLYIFILSMAFSGLAYGQFFEETQETNPPPSGEAEFFNQPAPEYQTNPNNNNNNNNGQEPDYGEDGPGNPGTRVPIDDWLFLLPLAGLGIGYYYLRRESKSTV